MVVEIYHRMHKEKKEMERENGEHPLGHRHSPQQDNRQQGQNEFDEKISTSGTLQSASVQLDMPNGELASTLTTHVSPSIAAAASSPNDFVEVDDAKNTINLSNKIDGFERRHEDMNTLSIKDCTSDLDESVRMESEILRNPNSRKDSSKENRAEAGLLRPLLKLGSKLYELENLQDSCDDDIDTDMQVKQASPPHDTQCATAYAHIQTMSDDTQTEKVHSPKAGQETSSHVEHRETEEVTQAAEKIEDAIDNGQGAMQLPGTNKSPDQTFQPAEAAQEDSAQAGVSPVGKTELEREMELYEASERDEQVRLLAPMRPDQRDLQMDEQLVVKDPQNDKKRALESPLQDRQKKRGRRIQAPDEKKKEEEDVCFICFDGGDLVLCDRRSCPKAYHLNCIGRDSAFFKKKGAWLCGWHFCSVCTKPGSFQCYTCPTAYCGNCVKEADFLLLRKRKGLCEECLPVVSMIEHNETVNAEGVEVDFEDQETYECLFKEYWGDLKGKLSLTLPEIDKDGKAVEGIDMDVGDVGSDTEDHTDNYDSGTDSEKAPEEADQDESEAEDESEGNREVNEGVPVLSQYSEQDMEPDEVDGNKEDKHEDEFQPPKIESWASKELLEFLVFMKEDPKKPLTRFAFTKLLWAYIKRQKLQDPRKKSQIVCDERLRNIFRKKIVGHFEMFKDLQMHFPPKGSVGATKSGGGASNTDERLGAKDDTVVVDGIDDKLNRGSGKDKRKGRRKLDEEKFERPDSDQYAAITPKNINLIYLRRTLMEDLLDDPEFHNKVVDTFVRIRVPGMTSKTEMCYRLVQVTGTRSQAERYKVGRRTTNVVLEILNLQKKEDATIDLVSNQDFNEEECQRLRQSIKCGFIKAMTVGQLEDKAIALQEAKVNDWFENERQRLINLRDRASEKGRKKELRECVEKLQELSSPAFRAAKLQARPEVSADPHMDPAYESDVSDGKPVSGSTWEKESGSADVSGRVGWEDTSFYGKRGDSDIHRSKPSVWDDKPRNRDVGRGGYESGRSGEKQLLRSDANYGMDDEKPHGSNEKEGTKVWDKYWARDHPQEQDRDRGDGYRWKDNGGGHIEQRDDDVTDAKFDYQSGVTPVFDQLNSDWGVKDVVAPAPSLPAASNLGYAAAMPSVLSQSALETMEKEKLWHYQDPSGTIQGPFSMEQLRKWNTTGFFPLDLKIWKIDQSRATSILLTEALEGRLTKKTDPWTVSAMGGFGGSGREFGGGSSLPRPSNAWRDNWGGTTRESGREAGDIGKWGAESGGRVEPGRSIRSADWDARDTSATNDRGSDWGHGRSSYGASTPTTGRAEDWSAPRSSGDNNGWGSPHKGRGESGSWGLQDNSGKGAGRSSWARSSSRDSSAIGSWKDATGRDGSRPSRGPKRL